jgi:RNA polymerase sigma-70 factor, ECF subfamily
MLQTIHDTHVSEARSVEIANADASIDTTTLHQQCAALLIPIKEQLVRFAYALTHNQDDAKDLTSDAIVIALEQFHTLKNTAAFKPWIFTIVRRVFLRSTKYKRRFVMLEASAVEEILATTATPDQMAEVHFLYAALDRLPKAQREAVTLFEIVGLSLEEIQQIQGVSLSGVKSRLVRGREKLATMLGVPATISNQSSQGN